MNTSFKYFAFISYNAKDTSWGKKLQKKLEHYKLPATLCSEHGWERRPIKPVFFAPTDIQPGGLSEELQERLKASKNLIVICSPNSAKSEWVGKEIEFFHHLGRTQNIHFFIVDGTPHSGNPDTECFNPIIEKLGLPEILGANINERVSRLPWLNKERAYVQLISKLLGVEFDTLWQRHKRQLTRKVIAWGLGTIAVLFAILFVWRVNQPFNVEVRLNEASYHNDNLPPLENAVVTIQLDNETKSDTIHSLDDRVVFNNIPHRYLHQEMLFAVSCPTFLDAQTTVALEPNVTLDIYRNEHYYGDVEFDLYNRYTETYQTGIHVSLAGLEAISDDSGHVSLFVPLEKQQRFYIVTCELPLEKDTISMPKGASDAVMVK